MLRIFLWYFFINIVSFVAIVSVLTVARVAKLKIPEDKIIMKIGENFLTYELIVWFLVILFCLMDSI